MSEEITVTAKKRPISDNITVFVNNKVLTRFTSFSISHSIDTVPMSFTLQYGLSEGEQNTDVLNFLGTEDDPEKRIVSGILTIGSKVEIYLKKQKVLTGYIENSTESYSHGEHNLYIDGRAITSVLVDSTTDLTKTGMIPSNLVSLYDVANYMFSGFNIKTIDKSTTPQKMPLAGYAQYDLTTHPYDYVSGLAQYEGKLLYDDEHGNMVIDEIPTPPKSETPKPMTAKEAAKKPVDTKPKKITDTTSQFENITVHKTSLGRYRNYRVIINAYGGPAGVDASLIQVPVIQDPFPNELPPGKNITIVSQAAYPDTPANMNGLVTFQQSLAQFMANNNWGRGQTISATATGFTNPITGKLWKINDLVKFDYKKPFIQGDFVVQSLTFSLDEYQGSQTALVFVRREALLQEPVTISPLILGVNPPTNKDDTAASKDKEQKLSTPDDTPANAKPVTSEKG